MASISSSVGGVNSGTRSPNLYSTLSVAAPSVTGPAASVLFVFAVVEVPLSGLIVSSEEQPVVTIRIVKDKNRKEIRSELVIVEEASEKFLVQLAEAAFFVASGILKDSTSCGLDKR